jgi:hypothetical protein
MLSCATRGLATCWSPVQGVLPTVWELINCKWAEESLIHQGRRRKTWWWCWCCSKVLYSLNAQKQCASPKQRHLWNGIGSSKEIRVLCGSCVRSPGRRLLSVCCASVALRFSIYSLFPFLLFGDQQVKKYFISPRSSWKGFWVDGFFFVLC